MRVINPRNFEILTVAFQWYKDSMRQLALKQYSKKIILNVFIITSQTDESESFGLVPRLANWLEISTLAV